MGRPGVVQVLLANSLDERIPPQIPERRVAERDDQNRSNIAVVRGSWCIGSENSRPNLPTGEAEYLLRLCSFLPYQ